MEKIMPFYYKSNAEILKESLADLSTRLDRQNELLEKIVKTLAKDKK